LGWKENFRVSEEDRRNESGLSFEDILTNLDREQAHITIRKENRRFGKPTTVIEGLRISAVDLEDLSRKLKKKLATGGSAKGGVILLQGDQRREAARALQELGFPEPSVV
jgi:translation initiation factor 1